MAVYRDGTAASDTHEARRYRIVFLDVQRTANKRRCGHYPGEEHLPLRWGKYEGEVDREEQQFEKFATAKFYNTKMQRRLRKGRGPSLWSNIQGGMMLWELDRRSEALTY